MDRDIQSISPSEGLVSHTADEGQCRLRVRVALEGSPQPGPRNEWGRSPAHTSLRLHLRVLSWASVQLSTPGSHLEHHVNLPLSQLEDLEPSEAESEGKKARGGSM